MKNDIKFTKEQQIIALLRVYSHNLEKQIGEYKRLAKDKDTCPVLMTNDTGEVFLNMKKVGEIKPGTLPYFYLQTLISVYPNRLAYEELALKTGTINSGAKNRAGAMRVCADIKRELKKHCPEVVKCINNSKLGVMIRVN